MVQFLDTNNKIADLIHKLNVDVVIDEKYKYYRSINIKELKHISYNFNYIGVPYTIFIEKDRLTLYIYGEIEAQSNYEAIDTFIETLMKLWNLPKD